MSTVYILKSLIDDKYYIGSTNDLRRRTNEHLLGKTKSLRYRRPFILVYSQEYNTLKEARQVERKLKLLKSRKIVDKIVNEQVIKLGP